MPVDTPPPKDLVAAVDRALHLLETVGQAPGGLTIGEIAAHCGMGTATARHQTATLTHRGYLLRWDTGRFTLGPALTDRVHDLAAQLDTQYRTGTTVAALAARLDRPAVLAYHLLNHHAAARDGKCPCARQPVA